MPWPDLFRTQDSIYLFVCPDIGYLGINLTQTFPEIYHKNFTPLIRRLKSDFQRWNANNLLPIGRINCIKMTVLPRFLYFFSVFQFMCANHFYSIDSYATSFIWAGKASRIQKRYLQRYCSSGGLGLLNLQFYYWVANCQKILYWCQSSDMVWCESGNNSCFSIAPSFRNL